VMIDYLQLALTLTHKSIHYLLTDENI